MFLMLSPVMGKLKLIEKFTSAREIMNSALFPLSPSVGFCEYSTPD